MEGERTGRSAKHSNELHILNSTKHARREIDRETLPFLAIHVQLFRIYQTCFTPGQNQSSRPVSLIESIRQHSECYLGIYPVSGPEIQGNFARSMERQAQPIHRLLRSAKPVSSNETIYRTVPRFEGFCTPSPLGISSSVPRTRGRIHTKPQRSHRFP